ncbi:hypothetical protein ACHAWF_012284 [Thalassiosira exigua]
MFVPHQPRTLSVNSGSGGAISIIPVPLRRNDPSSPWCYAASLAPPMPLDDDEAEDADDASTTLLPPGANFLATQVWPSSRIASTVVERHMDPSWTVCELGCGPGLPSLTAAKSGARKVIATDVDELALEMVAAAAIEQGFMSDHGRGTGGNGEQRFVTRQFDLTSQQNQLPDADLYILSDVFESAAVADGAARHVQSLLSRNRETQGADDVLSRVWVFAQSDRAQRESFLQNMKEWYDADDTHQRLADWTMNHSPYRDEELWLFDLDETMVEYN